MSEKKISADELIEFYQRQIEKRTGSKPSKSHTRDLIQAFGETVVALAQTGKVVGVTGFGSFRVVNLKGFTYTGGLASPKETTVAPRRALRFTASDKNKNL